MGGQSWCQGGDVNISWYDAARYIPEYNFWKDMDSQSCENFELFTGQSCWSFGRRALNPSAKCQGKECSLVDAGRCCVNKRKTCLNKNSCCLWGSDCHGCPWGNEWVGPETCGSSRRCKMY